jgi:glutamate/aspartate transport system substrate-binding protein
MDKIATRRLLKISALCMITMTLLLGAGPGSAADGLYGTLEKINDSNTVTIGHREASHPFSYVDDHKKPVGYAMDLCAKIVDEIKTVLKKQGLTVTYVAVNPQNRIPMVMNHAVDLECGSTTNTLARQNQVDFSSVYFATGTRVLARKSHKAAEIEDFNGKLVGVIAGSTNERAVKAMMTAGSLKDIRIVEIKDYTEGLSAVEGNRVDAFVTDDIVLFGLIAKSSQKSDLMVVGRLLTYDPYGIMMRRDDSAFRLVVNRALAAVYRSGEINRIYAKWFDPIGVPMSPIMKAGFELQALPE